MHIPPFDNQNKPIIDINDDHVPLNCEAEKRRAVLLSDTGI